MFLIKKIALFLVIVIVALTGIAYLLPRNVHAERETVVAAPPAALFVLLNGFRRFQDWSPWADLDPNAKYEHSGPEQGIGAKLSWTGDPGSVGSGSQTIIDSLPYQRIRCSLDFGSEGVATSTFTLAAEGDGTRITWGFDTDLGMNPIGRYFGLLLDGMIGKDFEKGLGRLKTLAEGLPKVDFAGLPVEDVETSPVPVAYVEAKSGTDDASIGTAIGAAYGQVGKFMAVNRLKQAGPPITINTSWTTDAYVFDAAIPIEGDAGAAGATDGPVRLKTTYAGKALKVVHKGPYAGMRETYDKLFAYAAARGLSQASPPWDEYVTDPGNTPEADLITHVYLPVK